MKDQTAHYGSDLDTTKGNAGGFNATGPDRGPLDWNFRTVERTVNGIRQYGICDVANGKRFVLQAPSLDDLRLGVQQLSGAIAKPPVDYDQLDASVPTSTR